MKILSVSILGIASYSKEQKIEFSADERLPITVLHGENGAGKTSTLNAILWCLTGRISPAFFDSVGGDPENFFNRDFYETGGMPLVEVEFEFDGGRFRAARKGLAKNIEGDFSLKKLVSGVWDSYTTHATATMTNILPPAIARYFIFDGEGFQTKGIGDNSVTTSVKTMLGFDHVETAISRIDSIIIEKEKKVGQLKSGRIKDQQKRASYERASNKIEELKVEQRKLADEKPEREGELADIQFEINSLNIHRVNALRSDEERRKRDIGKALNDVRSFENERLDLIGKYYRSIFGRALFDDGIAIIEESREKGVIPGKYSRQLIEDLKSAGVCMCGRSLGQEELVVLESKIKGGFTDGFQQRLTEASACQKDDQNLLDRFRTEYSKVMSGINDSNKALTNLHRRLEEIQQELVGLEDFKDKLRDLVNQEAIIKARLSTIEQDLTNIQTALNENHFTRKNYAPTSEGDSDEEIRLAKQIFVLKEALDYARAFLAAEFEEAHEFILEEMNKFIGGTNIPYGVELDKAFKFAFHDARGQVVVGSTGERKTLEYAFLCCLVKLVRQKSEKSDGLLKPGSRIPLVLDAPFSELAETYVSYISDMLLSVADQLTFLMFNKDWQAFQHVCAKKIGKEYVLVKNISSSSEGRTEEVLNFGGKDYACVRYGADIDHTSLELVNG
jgi:DNA sulfur modification protein DndD